MGTIAEAGHPVTGQSGEPQAEAPASIADMARRVVADASALVRAELRLARLETADNVSSAGSALVRVIAGAIFLALALTFLTVAMVVALANMIGLLWALLAVAGGTALIGLILLLHGRRSLDGFSLVPKQSMARISADIDRLSERAEAVQSAVQATRTKE